MPSDTPSRPNFRRYDPHQTLLLPPDLEEWLPEGHLARFVADVVDHDLDLAPFFAVYENAEGGSPAFHPALLLKLVLYGYSIGVSSSRRLERATYDDLAFRYLAADQHPTYSTIARFRERNLPLLDGLFERVLHLCEQAEMVELGQVALDGTKVKANASKHKAMSHKRLVEHEKELREIAQGLLRRAQEVDAAEDRLYGPTNPIRQLPPDWKERLQKVRAARKALEEREKEKARAAGRPEEVPPTAQWNFTDPDSRIMPDGANHRAFLQAYNCQAAVDAAHQVIVAAEVSQEPQDKRQMVPMVDAMQRNLGRLPERLLTDTGYFGEEMITEVERRGPTVYCPPDRGTGAPRRGRPPRDESFVVRMARRVRGVRGRAVYRHRKGIVEPVFGQIKQGRGLRQFLLRGYEKVRAEWKLWCLTHNLRKLYAVRAA